MHAFLFPHKLETRKDAYIAALHHDQKYAQKALTQWVSDTQPDDIVYHQHKLASIAFDRFRIHLEGHALEGFFQNIHRQSKLRARSNLILMGNLLTTDALQKVKIIALGETREMMLNNSTTIDCFDVIEWAVEIDQLKPAVAVLKAQGFKPAMPMRNVMGRKAFIILMQDNLKRRLRLTGLKKFPELQIINTKYENLFLMNDENYWQFMGSRQASLNIRRDQVLFDMRSEQNKVPNNIMQTKFNKFSPAHQIKTLFAEVFGFSSS